MLKHTLKYLRVCILVLFAATAATAQKGKPLTEKQRIEFDAHFINGNKHIMLKNADEALKEFKMCLDIDPDNADVYYLVGSVYLQKGLLLEAEAYSQKATLLDKQNTWYKKQLADVLRLQKKYPEAAAVYKEIAKTEKNPVSTLLDATYMYVLARDYNKAISILDEIEKKAGINEDIVKQKETIYLSQNKVDKAVKEVEKLVKAYPDNMEYLGMLADLYLVWGKTDKALELYRKILDKEPDNGLALMAVADYYKHVPDNDNWYKYLKAGVGSRSLEIKEKLNAIVGFISGREFGDQQKAKAYELVDVFMTANPEESTAFMLSGDLLMRDKKPKEAHESYKKATQLEPSNYVAWQQLVFSAVEMQDSAVLLEDCEKAIEYFPNDPLFYVYLNVASIQLKQYDKAINSALKGIEIAGENVQLQVQLYASLGDAYNFNKQYSASDSAFEQAITLDPDNAYALNNYAYFLSLRKEKLDKAESMSKKTIELDPRSASYFDTYGWVLYQKKEYTKAREAIERSLQISPENAEVLEHLGDVLYMLNEKDKALQNWIKSKELGGDGAFLDKKIKDKKLYE